MNTLYEMTGNIKALQEIEVDDENGLQAIKDTLESVEMEFNDKGVAIVKLISNLDKAMVAPIDDEIKRLQARKKTIQNRQESLREYLRDNMIASGISKIECPLFSITIRKPSKQVNVYDESALPDQFITVKTTIAPDKKAITDAIKGGQEVPGAELVDGKQSLLIK